MLKKLARDSVPQWREILLSHIYSHPGKYSVKDLTELIKVPSATLYRHVEDLEICGVFKHHKEVVGRATVKRLYITGEVEEHIRESEVFKIDYIE